MVTLFHVTGAYVYVDPWGKAEKVEDVFSKIRAAREHYEKVGLGGIMWINSFDSIGTPTYYKALYRDD